MSNTPITSLRISPKDKRELQRLANEHTGGNLSLFLVESGLMRGNENEVKESSTETQINVVLQSLTEKYGIELGETLYEQNKDDQQAIERLLK